ncbi:hypothetical protein ASC66_06265 [Leifsonia sp. Root4]|uniref:DUF4287 domain-containing protein n=1 Tax=Leifsonia sp. Root4 TaxID=1736525 RepID=UPI0006F60A84|nr:DUF4287 domain-containing protein [Leifsonia sp. Root4]KQW06143.1 hypothetical protein ASC66_06265 [Leifsonia sp. Root4]
MAEEIVTGRQDGVSDDSLRAATGKTWAEWFAILDAEGAAAWKHSVIARWLDANYPLGGWWAQGVTVGYEQARGIRNPGQRQDGSYEVSASKTLPREQQETLDAVIAAVAAELGAPASESRAVRHITARWPLSGHEGETGSILATAAPSKAGKTSVSLTWSRLEEPEDVAPAKLRLQGWLQAAARVG